MATKGLVASKHMFVALYIYSGTGSFIDEKGFRSAVYMIDIGQNDLLMALYASNLTYEPVAKQIPSFLAEIKLAIQVSPPHFIILNSGYCRIHGFDSSYKQNHLGNLFCTYRTYTHMVAENFGYTTPVR